MARSGGHPDERKEAERRRLAAALRANLGRRKERLRGGASSAPEDAAGADAAGHAPAKSIETGD